MHEARRLGQIRITERPRPGRKNLPNVVEIISPEWRTWLRRGPSALGLIGSNSSKMVSPTKMIDLGKRVAEEEARAANSLDGKPKMACFRTGSDRKVAPVVMIRK